MAAKKSKNKNYKNRTYKHKNYKHPESSLTDLCFDLSYAVLILFIIAFVPLVVSFANNIPTAPEEISLFRSPEFQLDFFSYKRSLCLKFSTILLGFVFALDFYRKAFASGLKLPELCKKPETVFYSIFFVFIISVAIADNSSKYDLFNTNLVGSILISVPIYFFIFSPLIFIAASTVSSKVSRSTAFAALIFFSGVMLSMSFSDFKYLNFNGANERYENMYVVLGYIILLVSIVQFADNIRKIKIVMFGLMFSAGIIGLVGALQFLGLDFFTTNLAARLIYGSYYVDGAGINIKFTQSFSLLYNPNSLGLYAAMATAFMLFTALLLPRNDILKIVFSALFVICALALIGSNSAAGILSETVALAIGAIIGAIYAFKKLPSVKPLLIGAAGICFFVCICVFFVPAVNNRVNYFVDKLFSAGSSFDHQFLTDLRVYDSTAELVSRTGSAKVTYLAYQGQPVITFNDEPMQPYQVDDPDENGSVRLHFLLPGFKEFSVLYNGQLVAFTADGFIYNFYDNAGTLCYVTNNATLYDINSHTPSWGFEGRETFASGRGYLWSRTIPLLKNTVIKGYGVDSFAEVFPQNDIVSRIRHLGQPGLLIDKAHNGYLQIAVTTGLPSMLAVIFLMGWFIIRSAICILSHNDSDKLVLALKFGAAIGILAYSVGFMSTDSTVGVSPMFWGLLGLGYALPDLKENSN